MNEWTTGLFEIFIAAFILTWLCAMTWVIFYLRFKKRLESRHPGILDEIGDLPGLVQRYQSPSEIKALLRLVGYLLRRRYSTVRNHDFLVLAERGRRILLCNITGLAALLILFPFLIMFESATTTGPDTADSDTRTDQQIATEHIDAGRFDAAVQVLDNGLVANPDDANLLFYRGLAHEKLEDFDAALADFTRVVALFPTHFTSDQHIDYLLARQQRWAEIIDYWDIYLALEPEDADAWLERGGTWYQLGNAANAAADALKSCDLGNDEGCQRYTQVTGDPP